MAFFMRNSDDVSNLNLSINQSNSLWIYRNINLVHVLEDLLDLSTVLPFHKMEYFLQAVVRENSKFTHTFKLIVIHIVDSRWRKGSHLGCWTEKALSSHLWRTREMGSNHFHPMALRVFWELSNCLFWNGSRPFPYLSASKGSSKFV